MVNVLFVLISLEFCAKIHFIIQLAITKNWHNLHYRSLTILLTIVLRELGVSTPNNNSVFPIKHQTDNIN
ncbi:hypothetical protein DHD08_14980 [Arenibacter sp. H213]|nr:hypothetical protein [Arenibacter sp. H213]